MKGFFEDQDGQTLVEFGLFVALVTLVTIGVVTYLARKKDAAYYEMGSGCLVTS